MMNKKGLLIVYSGPSGVGKGTLLTMLLQQFPTINLSVSATTRPPRMGEVDGVHYNFIELAEFKKLIDQNAMLEYTEYDGCYYGTPREPIERFLQEGKDVVLEIEVDGAKQVKKLCDHAIYIFIMPPKFNALEQRLLHRNTEDAEKIAKRVSKGREEIANAGEYDYIIVNDDVKLAYEKLKSVIIAEHCRTQYNQQIMNEVLENA